MTGTEPFSAESLPDNRAGRLSDNQREAYQRLVRKQRRHFIQRLATIFMTHGLADDVKAGVVEMDEGFIKTSDLEQTLWASVDDRRMRYGPLSVAQYKALAGGPTGRIYYLPRSKLVVNYEPIEPAS
jgi:hypothetical protein